MLRDRLLPLISSGQDGSAGAASRGVACCAPAPPLGGGLLLSIGLPLPARKPGRPPHEDFAPSAFVRIGRDGSVTLTIPQVEMGQGTYTAMAMLIAEELDVELAQVQVEHAPADDTRFANPLLGFQVDGRLDLGAGVFRTAARGRCRRPLDADRGRRRPMAGRSRRLPHGKRRRRPWAEWPAARLWRAR